MFENLIGPTLAFLLGFSIATLTSLHVILYKRDARAAMAWVAIVWLVPGLGALLYFLFGINRIKRRAQLMRANKLGSPTHADGHSSRAPDDDRLPVQALNLRHFARLMDQVCRMPLQPGCRLEPLVNGDEVFPAMIEAIDRAEQSIALATYIFDCDWQGEAVADALARAVKRGVAVRVLIDGVGALYSRPSMIRKLRGLGVTVAPFMRSLIPWKMAYLNLRNHRKVLVVDGVLGFTGGINIRAGNCLESMPENPIQDLHFRVSGPVVRNLMEVFAEDWLFTADERLQGQRWYPKLSDDGPVSAMVIAAGPDEEVETLTAVKLGALSQARDHVRIVTPYFLPDPIFISALRQCARRGVSVEIVLPEKNNIRWSQWATMALLDQVMEVGCRVWLTPEPFDHSKAMTVDNTWSLIGSANWDARSLRLNFELDVGCFDMDLTERLNHLFAEKMHRGRELTLVEVRDVELPFRLRNNIAHLMLPYL